MSAVYELKTWLHNLSGNFFQNVFHYDHPESASISPWAHAKNLITAWATNIQPSYLAILGADVLLDFITARRVTGGGGPSATTVANASGTGAADSISAGLAIDVAWINSAPTNRLGHTYICCNPQGVLDGDQWNNGYVTDVDTWISDQSTNLVLGGGDGNAVFGMFTRKTALIHANISGEVRPKPTLLNKRTTPIF
jgi:hypothetical protein